MKLPRTMSEALKLGYSVDGGDSYHDEGEKTATGYCLLVMEVQPELKVPYVASFKFGRPRPSTWNRRGRA